MRWNTEYVLGNSHIDETHREFVKIVNAMLLADAATFDACLDAFAVHAKRHFEEEDRLMAETEYTNARCHIDEHQAVLASVSQVRALSDDQRLSEGYRLARELTLWFPEHLDVMDRGLVDWVVRYTTGGAPLKFSPKAAIMGEPLRSGIARP